MILSFNSRFRCFIPAVHTLFILPVAVSQCSAQVKAFAARTVQEPDGKIMLR